jgi:hypothetical protein
MHKLKSWKNALFKVVISNFALALKKLTSNYENQYKGYGKVKIFWDSHGFVGLFNFLYQIL